MAKNQKASKETQDAKNPTQEDIQVADLANHAEMSYLEYAMSVVKGRAIPSVEDGLKPVQRRILYAMRDLGLSSSAKPKKSARVVGDVIGKYHPHGDSAVYEAMVRTAQNFSLRYPLVIGEGNFGSRDGDSAAAMRYTEAKMAPFADTFLSELAMETVDWAINYDNTMQEPKTLPARLPNILLNGASGIGVGIASEIPPHNLCEVVDASIAIIKNPKMTLDEAMAFIPGPDYPTGGQIISNKEDIRKAYSEGRGSVRARAKWRIEHEGTKNWRIVVDELPYPSSAQRVMEEIDRVFNPKPKEKKGKKVFSQEQLRLKTLFSQLIEKFIDSSDKDNPIRIVIEPKNHKQDPQELVNALLAYTSMEMNCPINLVAVGLDKVPKQKPLMEILGEWASYRVATVERRTQFEHRQASHRMHILEGRLLVLDHIEEVIRIIKNSDDPKKDLMARFSLSEIQADDVLEIRLRQLARLERGKIEDEKNALAKEIARLNKLLESKTAMKNQVIKELEADKKTYGDARRTIIQEAEKIVIKEVGDSAVSDDPVTVAISERGWIRVKTGHGHDAAGFAFKSGDAPKDVHRAIMSDYVVFVDETGKSYSVQLKDLPSAKGGEDVPISTLADFGGNKLAFSIVGNGDRKMVVASDSGYGFICKISDMATRIRAGKNLITVEAGSKAITPALIPDGIDFTQTSFAALSSNGRLLIYRLSEINELPKGKGVALMGLDEGQRLQQIAVLPENAVSISIEGRKTPLAFKEDDFLRHFQNRSSSKKGKPVEDAKGRAVSIFIPPAEEPTEEGGD